MIGLIVVLVLLVILMIGGFIAYFVIKRKIREFSREVFHTDSLKEGIGKMEAEYATTPKSVSAMTSLYLPKITRDFPDFSYDEMKERAQNTLTSYLLGISTLNAGALVNGNSELQNQLENVIALLKNQDLREHYDSVKIHRTEISNYTKKDGRCIVTFQSSLQCYHYITDNSGAVREGHKDVLFQTKYDTDLIYIQDRSKVETDMGSAIGVNCPNCGAPISKLGAKFCEYCGTGIIELNIKAWSFSDIRVWK